MNIVNIIHIGNQTVLWDDMSPEQKKKVAMQLNEQSLKNLGYRRKEQAVH